MVVVYCLKYEIFKQKRENINEKIRLFFLENQVPARSLNLTAIIYDIKGKKRLYLKDNKK